jgi:hypothetical protein
VIEKTAKNTASLNLAWSLHFTRQETGEAREAKGKTNARQSDRRSPGRI